MANNVIVNDFLVCFTDLALFISTLLIGSFMISSVEIKVSTNKVTKATGGATYCLLIVDHRL